MRKALTVSLETGDNENIRAGLGCGLCARAPSVALHAGLMKSVQLSNRWQRRGKNYGRGWRERAKSCAQLSPPTSQPPAGPPICKPCQPLAPGSVSAASLSMHGCWRMCGRGKGCRRQRGPAPPRLCLSGQAGDPALRLPQARWSSSGSGRGRRLGWTPSSDTFPRGWEQPLLLYPF